MPLTDKEYILCAAYWFKDWPLKNTETLRMRGVSPYNVDKGIVLCGWRHGNVIHQMVGLFDIRMADVGEYVDGFLTSTNRFVERVEARRIAIEAGSGKGG